MKTNLTNSYLSKLTSLAIKFHKDEASISELVQLKLLINAFKKHTKTNKVSPDIAFQFAEIRKLSQL